jgi:hypothetical protein
LPEQRAIQHGYNPVGFRDILGITPRNNLTALGEIGTVTITTSDSGNDDITPSGVSANALIGTVTVNPSVTAPSFDSTTTTLDSTTDTFDEG